MDLVKFSKRMSKILRHDPHPLKMDSKGWVSSVSLTEHLGIKFEDLEVIVDTNEKKRFMFNEDKTLIRATQGHSQGVAPEKEHTQIRLATAGTILYHGTDDVTWELIKNDKIIPGKRQYVHWTLNKELAEKRAMQRKFHNKTKPVLITLNVQSYLNGSGKLYLAENEVYLTPEIEGSKLQCIFI
jgi:putative RNA 2'-phosphotransferase